LLQAAGRAIVLADRRPKEELESRRWGKCMSVGQNGATNKRRGQEGWQVLELQALDSEQDSVVACLVTERMQHTNQRGRTTDVSRASIGEQCARVGVRCPCLRVDQSNRKSFESSRRLLKGLFRGFVIAPTQADTRRKAEGGRVLKMCC